MRNTIKFVALLICIYAYNAVSAQTYAHPMNDQFWFKERIVFGGDSTVNIDDKHIGINLGAGYDNIVDLYALHYGGPYYAGILTLGTSQYSDQWATLGHTSLTFWESGTYPTQNSTSLGYRTPTGSHQIYLPNNGGTIPVSVNGNTANTEGEITVSLGAADVSGLTENQFLFGASDGSISQSEYVLFDNGMYAGYGAGIRIRNESSPMVLPSWAMLRLEALEGNAEIQLQAGSIAKSGIRFFNWTGNTQWYVHMDEAENFLIQNIAEDDDFRVNASTLRFTENELGEHTFFMNGGGFEIQNNDNPAVLKLDQDGTEFTIANDGTSLEIDADAVDITGDLTAANLAAGTYTPTAANVSNCATFGTVYGHYMSYGNMVWINIKVDINATSSSKLTTASFTLPAGLTSDFTASQDVIGNMSWITTINGSGGPGRVYADATSDLIYVEYRPSNTATFKVNITASYVIQ